MPYLANHLCIPLTMRKLCVFCFAVITGGCTSIDAWMYQGYAAAPLDEKAVVTSRQLMDVLTKGESSGAPIVPADCFGIGHHTAKACEAPRNRAVAILALASEDLCIDHRRSIYGRDAAWNIGTGTLTSLFAGMAAVVDSERRKSVLSALALFTNAERSLVNETVYKQLIVTSVDKKIIEIRALKQAEIYESLKLPISSYTMERAILDIVEFHYSCSFMTGLQRALDEGTQGSNVQKVIRLKASIAAVANQMSSLDTKLPAGKDQYDLLKSRLTSLNTALIAVESQ